MFLQMFTTAMSLIALYVGARLVLPLPVALWLRLLGCAGLLALANRITWLRLWHVTLPDAMLLATAWLQVSVLVLFLLCLATDVVMLVMAALRQPAFPPVARAVVLGAAALAFSGWGVAQAVRVPPVRELTVAIRNLPQDLAGLRIAVLADLHIGPIFRRPWVEQVVARALATRPDLIVLPGDAVDNPVPAIAPDMAPLAGLAAPLGVFASPGNHEYIYGVDAAMHALAGLGLHVLFNEHAALHVGNATLVVAGVGDRRGGHRPGRSADLDAALAGAPEPGPDTVRILLAHRPDDAAQAAARGVALQISGHTHGGQILPMQPLSARINGGYVEGFYDVGGMVLYVANGAGLWSGTPLRLGVPSEIPVLRLERAPAGS